jgi:hypothetical protein
MIFSKTILTLLDASYNFPALHLLVKASALGSALERGYEREQMPVG